MFEKELQHYEDVRLEYERRLKKPMGEDVYREYSEILFSTHSCAIEGNSFTIDDSRDLKEMGLAMIPKGRKLLECVEMADHFDAFEYVVNNVHLPLTEDFLKETNRRLTQHTLPYLAKDCIPGEYTNVDMAAGDTVFGDHELLIARVPKLLESTERTIVEEKFHPMVVAARFHGFFEYLHPFRDGNGRTGRLMSNYILLRMGHPVFTVLLEERQQYISALRRIRTDNTDEHLIAFFITAATRHMEDELAQKRRNNRLAFMF